MIAFNLLIANKTPTIGASKVRAKCTHLMSIYETIAEHEDDGQELNFAAEC